MHFVEDAVAGLQDDICIVVDKTRVEIGILREFPHYSVSRNGRRAYVVTLMRIILRPTRA